MGHNIGVSGSYYKPTEKEVLVDYLRIMPQLIINDKFRLSQQVQELKEKNQDKDLLIKAKFAEKDNEIIELQRSIKFLTDTVNRTLLTNPENKIITAPQSNGMIVKGIELKPEINHKTVGQVISSNSNKKKK